MGADHTPSDHAEQLRYLTIYLHDHHAAGIGGEALARRCFGPNRQSPLGDYLKTLIAEIREERRTLEQLLARLDTGPSRLKGAAAWGVERLGRLKLNGRVRGYSPLSRLLELEGLCSGVLAKENLWRSLMVSALVDRGIVTREELEQLADRAEGQLRSLEGFRVESAQTAFAHDAG